MNARSLLQVYGTQMVGLIIGITNVCIGGATLIIGITMCSPPARHSSLPHHTIFMYWFDYQSNRHRILIEDLDSGDEIPALHSINTTLFASSAPDRAMHGAQAPPGSPRATDL